MFHQIMKRILMMPFIVLGIVTIAFVLSHNTRGDPLSSLLNDRQMGNPEVVEATMRKWGLDQSLSRQYIIYVSNLAVGDFGTSFRTKRPVAQDLVERLPATLELVISAMIFGSIAGITLGVMAAKFRDTIVDHTIRFFALLGSSTPIFWSALIMLYIFSVQLDWLPGPGRLDARTLPPPTITGFYTIDSLLSGEFATFREALTRLFLPSLILGWTVIGVVTRMVRSNMLDVLTQDYIVAARARGARDTRVMLHHALRNALIPTLTILGFTFAYLITGAVLTETIFSWPGIGSYAVASTKTLDYPAIIGVTIIGGLGFLISNMVTDIAYLIVDPRVKI
tara:strand:+ start:574 stop:1584 length:1011 start_codon:yes stop_codon:yes gene_type:complete